MKVLLVAAALALVSMSSFADDMKKVKHDKDHKHVESTTTTTVDHDHDPAHHTDAAVVAPATGTTTEAVKKTSTKK